MKLYEIRIHYDSLFFYSQFFDQVRAAEWLSEMMRALYLKFGLNSTSRIEVEITGSVVDVLS